MAAIKATTKTYSEKLRDPRWQKKRLEVLQRDEFACLKCGANDRTLNVHHRYYLRGREPWQYPLTAFATLCEECHEEETDVDGADKLKEVFAMLGCWDLDLEEFADRLHRLTQLDDPKYALKTLGHIACHWELMSWIIAIREMRNRGDRHFTDVVCEVIENACATPWQEYQDGEGI